MCGVVGYIGPKAVEYITKALKALQYRGYDSHGTAFLLDKEISVNKGLGPVKDDYADSLNHIVSTCGIGHVRWATHGKVTLINAHPHLSDNLALVHNGIVKNTNELKLDKSYISDTDTEVLAHWLANDGSLSEVEGDFAVLFIRGQCLFAACRNIPLYFARHNDCIMVASSMNVFDDLFEKYECASLESDVLYQVNDLPFLDWQEYKGTINSLAVSTTFEEIREQKNFDFTPRSDCKLQLNKKRKLILYGCGSSYHAASVAQYFFRRCRFENVEVYIPDELKNFYFHSQDAQYIAISQSGETKDMLDVTRFLKNKKASVIAITNGRNSTLEKLADKTINLNCGVEKGVAATKTYTATLFALLNIAFDGDVQVDLKNKINEIFEAYYPNIPRHFLENLHNVYLFGSGIVHRANREGALKLKEMAMLHAEAIYTSEVKHGPLVLLNEQASSIFVVDGQKCDYILDNIHQVRSRGGKVLVLANKNFHLDGMKDCDIIHIPESDDLFVEVFLITIYWQIVAWEIGNSKGVNIDRPVNLAKCVTV